MKRLLIIVLAIMPLSLMAQSEWELPDDMKAKMQESKKEQKESTESLGKDSKGDIVKIEPKYAAGTVPEVNGKVEWNKTITASGKSADELYSRVLKAIQVMTKDTIQSNESRIAAVNKSKHIIAAKFDEEMVFSSSFLSKDYTCFRYTLIANCEDGAVNIRLCRISYEYNVNKKEIFTAEEWITDSNAINKKGTKLYPLSGKFRKKTIDRVDEIFKYFSQTIK